jgi:integrase
MALTALQIEQAGLGKPKSLNPGRHPDEHGLYLEVISPTSKSFTGRYTVLGKEVWRGIGSTRTTSLKQAREKHLANQRLAADGIDPKEHRKAQQAAAAVAAAKTITFQEMAERFIASHEAGWKNAIHRQQWRNTLRDYVFPHIGAMPLQAIDTGAAMQILQQPVDGTTFWLARTDTASRTRGRCEAIMEAAAAQNYCDGKNPFAWKVLKHLLPAKKKVREIKHHAAPPHREMPVLMGRLRARTSISARGLEFTCLNVSRINEVVQARWSEFDLANARWNIPGSRMKSGQPHTVFLARRAVEILRELYPNGLKPDDLVFPITGAALTKMLKLAGYGDFTVHGTARATFKTWADECTGFRDAVSESCLAHIEGNRVKRACARGEFEQQRAELMEMWSRHCASPLPDSGANRVVPLRSPA